MIWIATATPWEANPLAKGLGLSRTASRRHHGNIGQAEVALFELGIGGEKARASLDSAAADLPPPQWLIHTGFAGAVQPGLGCGTIVVDVWGLDSEVREKTKEIASALGTPFQFGRIVSSERVLRTREEKAAFGSSRRAVAVDTENETSQAWASEKGISFIATKSILDDLEQPLLPEAPIEDTPIEVLRYLASHWAELGMLTRLWFLRKKALNSLVRFLRATVPEISALSTHP